MKLNESLRLRDLGISAWSGANVETGALARLLATEKAVALSNQRGELTREIEQLRKIIAESTGSLFDTSFAENLLPKLYESTELAKECRAKANFFLRRIIDIIKLIASEEHVIVTLKDSLARLVAMVNKISNSTPMHTTENCEFPVMVTTPPSWLPGFLPDEETIIRLKKFMPDS